MDIEQAIIWHDKNCHGEALRRIKSRQAVACMKREIDRLRAELAKAQDAMNEAESAERLWRVELAGQQECTLREMNRTEAAEARIKELELALSGKTFSYDPDSYQKGFIAGMEEALEIALNGYTANLCPQECQDLALEIRDRIEEVKNETNKA